MHVDELTFDAFFRRYYPLALNYLYRRVRDRELAEELVEAAFVRLIPTAARADVTNYTSWVYGVVLNELRRYRRSMRARRQSYERYQEWRARVIRQTASSNETLDFEAVSAAMSRLADKYSTVLSLRYFERLTDAEIAKIVKAPESTVRTRLRRGLMQLRAQLGVRPS